MSLKALAVLIGSLSMATAALAKSPKDKQVEVLAQQAEAKYQKGEFRAAAELLPFEDKIRDLREALLGRGVRAAKHDVALFENVADVPVG